ncbi:hypothetical protein [Paenibacillus amylolyticus]|uniref:hypothetical protein n=1 Tax=Paenibacillus amylolyticus TaxID=1451 RepID=UPI003EB8783A
MPTLDNYLLRNYGLGGLVKNMYNNVVLSNSDIPYLVAANSVGLVIIHDTGIRFAVGTSLISNGPVNVNSRLILITNNVYGQLAFADENNVLWHSIFDNNSIYKFNK